MRKLIVSEFVTLDGVMQAPGGKDEDRDGGFEHGGWTMPYWHNDIGHAFGTLMKDVDALLLGRRTYITHAAAFHALLAHDLVDELHPLLYPLTVGGGKRLLPEGVYATFKLGSATPYPTGVVGLHYNRQRTL